MLSDQHSHVWSLCVLLLFVPTTFSTDGSRNVTPLDVVTGNIDKTNLTEPACGVFREDVAGHQNFLIGSQSELNSTVLLVEACCDLCTNNSECQGYSFFESQNDSLSSECKLYTEMITECEICEGDTLTDLVGWKSASVFRPLDDTAEVTDDDERDLWGSLVNYAGENLFWLLIVCSGMVVLLFILSHIQEARKISYWKNENLKRLKALSREAGVDFDFVQAAVALNKHQNSGYTAKQSLIDRGLSPDSPILQYMEQDDEDPNFYDNDHGFVNVQKRGRHTNILLVGLAFIDFAVDCGFVVERFKLQEDGVSDTVGLIPGLALLFVVLPVLLNLAIVMDLMRGEFKRDEMRNWFFNNSLLGTVTMLISLGNAEALSLLVSRTFGGLQKGARFFAPVTKNTRERFFWLGIIGNLTEDVPQIIIQVVVIRTSTSDPTLITLIAFGTSAVTLLFGILRRSVFMILLCEARADSNTHSTTTRRTNYAQHQQTPDDVRSVIIRTEHPDGDFGGGTSTIASMNLRHSEIERISTNLSSIEMAPTPHVHGHSYSGRSDIGVAPRATAIPQRALTTAEHVRASSAIVRHTPPRVRTALDHARTNSAVVSNGQRIIEPMRTSASSSVASASQSTTQMMGRSPIERAHTTQSSPGTGVNLSTDEGLRVMHDMVSLFIKAKTGGDSDDGLSMEHLVQHIFSSKDSATKAYLMQYLSNFGLVPDATSQGGRGSNPGTPNATQRRRPSMPVHTGGGNSLPSTPNATQIMRQSHNDSRRPALSSYVQRTHGSEAGSAYAASEVGTAISSAVGSTHSAPAASQTVHEHRSYFDNLDVTEFKGTSWADINKRLEQMQAQALAELYVHGGNRSHTPSPGAPSPHPSIPEHGPSQPSTPHRQMPSARTRANIRPSATMAPRNPAQAHDGPHLSGPGHHQSLRHSMPTVGTSQRQANTVPASAGRQPLRPSMTTDQHFVHQHAQTQRARPLSRSTYSPQPEQQVQRGESMTKKSPLLAQLMNQLSQSSVNATSGATPSARHVNMAAELGNGGGNPRAAPPNSVRTGTPISSNTARAPSSNSTRPQRADNTSRSNSATTTDRRNMPQASMANAASHNNVTHSRAATANPSFGNDDSASSRMMKQMMRNSARPSPPSRREGVDHVQRYNPRIPQNFPGRTTSLDNMDSYQVVYDNDSEEKGSTPGGTPERSREDGMATKDRGKFFQSQYGDSYHRGTPPSSGRNRLSFSMSTEQPRSFEEINITSPGGYTQTHDFSSYDVNTHTRDRMDGSPSRSQRSVRTPSAARARGSPVANADYSDLPM